VIERTLRIVSVAATLIVLASFAMFAVDEFRGASQSQQRSLRGEDPALPTTKTRKQPRRAIDGAAHTLLAPFAGLATGSGAWAQRLVPTLLALLVYGFGIGVLARFARGLP
jgi:hypothetical protein